MTSDERAAAMAVVVGWATVDAALAAVASGKVEPEQVSKHVAKALLALQGRVATLARFATADSTHPAPEAKALVRAVLTEAIAAGRVVDADGHSYCDAYSVRDWVQMALAATETAPGVPFPQRAAP